MSGAVEGVALLPCPFCGGTDGDLVETYMRATEDLRIWAVECERCGAERASDASEVEARAFWNTRTTPPARSYADGAWQPIAEFDMANIGPSGSVIVAVTCEGREPVIGEAYFNPDAYEGTWWWAGQSHGEYHDSPIEEMQHGTVTHFQPMPTFPAIRLSSQGEKA